MATKATRKVGNILALLTIVQCCCSARGQQLQTQLPQLPQQQPHKYQQLQYQMQQQQQYEYQQQMQQQQQHYYQQQYQQQKQPPLMPMSLPLQQQQQQQLPKESFDQQLAPTQMLKTGVSLVVDDGTNDNGSGEQLGQKEYFSGNGGQQQGDSQQSIRRRPGTRKRKRRPQLTVGGSVAPSEDPAQYWRGRVDDDAPPTSAATHLRDETRPNAGLRRRKQPAIREPLAALEKEQKLYEMRDKQRQEIVADVTGSNRNKAYRRPYSQAKKELQALSSAEVSSAPMAPTATTGNLAATSTGAKSPVDLKNILKNSGGLSLSEILQQKNLSLDDLLKGKQNALLALQTTASAPAQKSEIGRPPKPGRRIPTDYLGSSPSVRTNSGYAYGNSEESVDASVESDDPHAVKSKPKNTALQRLKLFGSSSRGPTQTNGEATTKRREPLTSSTATTTTTTRLPLYKKRQQMRPTLKSPSLFKGAVPSAATTKEAPTSMEVFTTTDITEDVDENSKEHEVFDDNVESKEEPQMEEEVGIEDAANGDSSEKQSTIPENITSRRTTSTSRRTFPPTSTTVSPSSSTISSSSNFTISANSKVKSNLSDHIPESNFIENDDRPVTKSTIDDSEEPNYVDDLENFFDDSNSNPNRNSNSNSKSLDSSVENITPRIDNPYAAKPTSYLDSVPDFDGVDDRTDLLELIEDRRSGNRLFKVLEQRNMTLEELIEHRKRGSSQLHLSTIVQNNSRFFPGQKVVLNDNMDIVTAFENFPHFNLMDLKSVKPDDIKTDSQGSSYFTSIIDIEPTDEIYKDGGGENGVRGPAYLSPQRSEKSLGFFPSWKTLALASLATTTRDAASKRNPFFLAQPKLLLENASSESLDEDFLVGNETNSIVVDQKPARDSSSEVDTVEAIENEVARAHDLLDLELSGHGFKRSPAAAASMATHRPGNFYNNMPAGIRSAIVASAAIVLTSLATFMVIFVVCRWKQRRRRKTNYMKTYNAMKSKLPTIANASRRSSLRNMDEMVGGVSTVSTTPVHHHHHQLQRQSSLLFSRGSRDSAAATAFSSSTNQLIGGRGAATLGNSGGIGSLTGSTTSLALSLRSAHNISTTKLNTMDPSSPEVQEYLFDTLRKSF